MHNMFMKQDNRPNPCFTPGNEPYLGRESVHHFDQVILWCLQANADTVKCANKITQTPLQKAATQIIPQGINIALSIRELVRQGYLFGAVVLMRPLIERAAIISYLCECPDEISKWEDGWKHRARPSMFKMLKEMQGEADIEQVKDVCDTFNHILHGDPIGANFNLVQMQDGGLGYSVSKSLAEPELCDFICFQSYLYLTILMARLVQCFPTEKPAA